MNLTSPAFVDGAMIPAEYTCDGANQRPPLEINSVPSNAKSLVLVMDDPDVPRELRADGVFDHWLVYNLSPLTSSLPAGANLGAAGLNSSGHTAYTGPCPPPNFEPTTHRYIFKLYALDIPSLEFITAPTKSQLLTAITGHIMAETTFIGRYDRSTTVVES